MSTFSSQAQLIGATAILFMWAVVEAYKAVEDGMEKAKTGNHNREGQNEAISDTRTSYCPTSDRAVSKSIDDVSEEVYTLATSPGTLIGGPPGPADNAGDATISIIWEATQPEPEEE